MVKFAYEGHQVNVKVTEAQSVKIPIPTRITLIGNNSGWIEDRAMKFACSMGFQSNSVTAIFVTWLEVTTPK